MEIKQKYTAVPELTFTGELCDFTYTDGVLVGAYKIENITLKEAILATEEKTMFLDGIKCPTVVDYTKVKYTSREAREFYSKNCGTDILAMALLINSPVGAIIGNFFSLVNKPPFPFKIFTDKDKAFNWARKYALEKEL